MELHKSIFPSKPKKTKKKNWNSKRKQNTPKLPWYGNKKSQNKRKLC